MDTLRFMHRLRQYVEAAGSQQKAAESLGISPQYLCDVLKGRREVGGKLAAAMGMVRIVSFVKAPSGE